MIGIYARVLRSGEHLILIKQNPTFKFLDHARYFGSFPIVEAWQASTHETLADAKASLMANYGLSWYNRARSQLKALSERGVA